MSSHREAPEISKDPVADSTDVYAFVSPDRPDAVTLIANYIPLQGPAGGPNFYEFGAEGFYVDLGSIFDLANLRPFQQLHAQYGMHVFSRPAPGVNATAALNVHSIAIQVPISQLIRRVGQ